MFTLKFSKSIALINLQYSFLLIALSTCSDGEDRKVGGMDQTGHNNLFDLTLKAQDRRRDHKQ
jgi:hypothetical protein